MAIVPKSQGGSSVAPVVGLPQAQPVNPGMEPALAGLARATSAFADIGAKIKLQQDESIVTDALTTAEKQWQNRLYNENDGILQRKGINALEGPDRKSAIDEGLESRTQILESVSGNLTTPRQRAALKKAWADRDRFAVDTLQRHMSTQADAYQTAVDAGYIDSKQQQLVTAQSPAERAIIIADIAAKANQIAQKKGIDGPALDSMIRSFTSAPLENAIAGLARTDPAAAKEMFERNKDFISADRYDAIVGRLETESITTQSQDLVDRIFASNPNAPLTKIHALIREQSSGKLEDDALGRASTRFSVNKQSMDYGHQALEDSITHQIFKYFGSSPADRTPEATTSLRDEVIRQSMELHGSSQEGLVTLFDKLAAGGKVETDWGLYNRLMTDPSIAKREGLTPVVLSSRLNGPELKQVLEGVRAVESGEILNDDGLNTEIKAQFDSWKISDDATQGKIRGSAIAEIRAKQSLGPVSAPERDAIIARHIAGYVNSGFIKLTRNAVNPAQDLREAAKASPDTLGLAMWRASNGGQYTARPEAVMGMYIAIQDKVKRARAIGGEDAVNAELEQIKLQGEDVRKRLHRMGYADAALLGAQPLIDAQEAAEQARKAELERHAEEFRFRMSKEGKALREYLGQTKAPSLVRERP